MATTTPQTTASKTSRVGKRPVELPKGVTVSISGQKVNVKGPKGELVKDFPSEVTIVQKDNELLVACDAPGRAAPRLQGLARALLGNMVEGCAEGYSKSLELHGTGYRVELKGQTLVCTLGFSHLINFELPKGITVDIPKDSKGQALTIMGADKAVVGQTAATIRGFRPPEPYGGKGVRYKGERIREKAGKSGK